MGRSGFLATFVFWLAAMSWLLFTKIHPVLDATPAPAPGFVEPGAAHFEKSCWDIQCQGEPIGSVANHTQGDGSGEVTVESTVELTDIPIGELLADLLSGWSVLTRWASPIPVETKLSVETHTRMTFFEGALQRFASRVQVDGEGAMFELLGERQANGLHVSVNPGEMLVQAGFDQPLFSSLLPVPEESLVIDALSPYSELRNLRVGKRWQMQSYRAFPPNQPLRTILATVERTEIVVWDGEIVNCFVIEFRDLKPQGPTASAGPSGYMWVDDSGTVLKQNMQVGGIQLDFLRKPAAFCGNQWLRQPEGMESAR